MNQNKSLTQNMEEARGQVVFEKYLNMYLFKIVSNVLKFTKTLLKILNIATVLKFSNV